MYVSSLCERARVIRDAPDMNLANAAALVMQRDTELWAEEEALPSYQPDFDSVVIVMQAAATVGNVTLVEDLWRHCLEKCHDSIRTDVRTINARLMVLKASSQRLELFDQELLPNLEGSKTKTDGMDAHTISQLLIPLVQADRVADLYRLVEAWISSTTTMSPNEQCRELHEGWSLILIASAKKGGDVETARQLFDRYLSVNSTNESVWAGALPRTLPQRRHFNILLDGYAQTAVTAAGRLENLQSYFDTSDLSESTMSVGIEQNYNIDCYESLEVVRKTAIQQAKELFRTMVQLQRNEPMLKVFPDDYTWGAMTRCCESSKEVEQLIDQTSSLSKRNLSLVVLRCALTQCGRLGDPATAFRLFDNYFVQQANVKMSTGDAFSNIRMCNALLNALVNGAGMGDTILDFSSNHGRKSSAVLSSLQGQTCTEAVFYIMDRMGTKNSQTYCLAAASLQHAAQSQGQSAVKGMELFRNATQDGIPADGRMVNAILRCFGDNIHAALDSWKTEMRPACLSHDKRYRNRGGDDDKKSIFAAYTGLLYVCGRAGSPDVAVRIVYAMTKEGIEPTELSYNNYKSGKRVRQALFDRSLRSSDPPKQKSFSQLLPKLDMMQQYENILYVECKKYDARDKRMEKDKRVRIIV